MNDGSPPFPTLLIIILKDLQYKFCWLKLLILNNYLFLTKTLDIGLLYTFAAINIFFK